MISGRLRTLPSGVPWPTVLGGIVSVTAVVLGLRFGLAGLAGTIAIGLFALFVSAAIIAARRERVPPTSPGGWDDGAADGRERAGDSAAD